jgi:hypothetical protein
MGRHVFDEAAESGSDQAPRWAAAGSADWLSQAIDPWWGPVSAGPGQIDANRLVMIDEDEDELEEEDFFDEEEEDFDEDDDFFDEEDEEEEDFFDEDDDEEDEDWDDFDADED